MIPLLMWSRKTAERRAKKDDAHQKSYLMSFLAFDWVERKLSKRNFFPCLYHLWQSKAKGLKKKLIFFKTFFFFIWKRTRKGLLSFLGHYDEKRKFWFRNFYKASIKCFLWVSDENWKICKMQFKKNLHFGNEED